MIPYKTWELGLIKAWGDVLYLGYRNLPLKIEKIVSYDETIKEFRNYFWNADEDEDLQDWMSDMPPTMNKGFALFDKSRINKMFSDIANKTPLQKELTVYRFSKNWDRINNETDEWFSFTTDPNIIYNGDKRKFKLKPGCPIVYTFGYADKNEVILNSKHIGM